VSSLQLLRCDEQAFQKIGEMEEKGVDEERRLVDGAKETRVNRQKNAAVTSRSSDGSHPLSPGVSPPRQNYIPETIVESDDECEEEDGVEEPAAFHQPLLVDSRTSTR
jgi:hypothetical protein